MVPSILSHRKRIRNSQELGNKMEDDGRCQKCQKFISNTLFNVLNVLHYNSVYQCIKSYTSLKASIYFRDADILDRDLF